MSDYFLFFIYLVQQPPPNVGQGLLIHEVSRSHTTTHHSQLNGLFRLNTNIIY